MALQINSLDYYDLAVLKNGAEFKIVPGGFSYGKNNAFIKLYSDNYTVEDLEKIFNNPHNIQCIKIMDKEHNNIMATLYDYIVIDNIQKEYKAVYYEGYNIEKNYYEVLTTDLIKITLRKQTAEDRVPQMEATMEYIAIMADIDIDEE